MSYSTRRRCTIRFCTRVSGALLVFAILATAQNQIATVMSDGPFRLRGANITPGQGVPSWPMIAGDTVRSGVSPATITIENCSTITLAPSSSGKVDVADKTPTFRLETGTAHYVLESKDCVKLFAGNTGTIPTDLNGDLQLGSNSIPKGWWTVTHTTMVLGAAGGAAALGVGVAKKKKSVYPCDDGKHDSKNQNDDKGYARCDD